jgi:hypothetical protein
MLKYEVSHIDNKRSMECSELSFFEKLPYEIVCHILLFVEKNYDDKLIKTKDPCLIFIIKFDEYINSQRKTNLKKSIKIYAMNYNILRIMSGMGGLAFSN